MPTPGAVLDALDEVARACGVDPVTVVVPAKRVAALAYIDSRPARITLDPAVAAAAASRPEMIRFLLAHELGHRARSTKSWTTLVGGVLLMVMGVWLIVVASFGVAGVTSDRVQWVFAWTYGALVLLCVGAWALAARRDRATELVCDEYASDVGFPLTEGAAASLQQLGRCRVRLPRAMRTHPDWKTRLRNAQQRVA